MTDPATLAAYEERFARNSRIDGYGLEVRQVLACPFCAAGEFMTLAPFDMAMQPGDFNIDGECSECGRTARAIVKRDGHGGTSMEVVQTGGEDPPEYLKPWPRRAEA